MVACAEIAKGYSLQCTGDIIFSNNQSPSPPTLLLATALLRSDDPLLEDVALPPELEDLSLEDAALSDLELFGRMPVFEIAPAARLQGTALH